MTPITNASQTYLGSDTSTDASGDSATGRWRTQLIVWAG